MSNREVRGRAGEGGEGKEGGTVGEGGEGQKGKKEGDCLTANPFLWNGASISSSSLMVTLCCMVLTSESLSASSVKSSINAVPLVATVPPMLNFDSSTR